MPRTARAGVVFCNADPRISRAGIGAARMASPCHPIDTPRQRLKLGAFRGELRQELRFAAARKPFEPDPGHAGEGTGRFPRNSHAPDSMRPRASCPLRLDLPVVAEATAEGRGGHNGSLTLREHMR